MQLVTQNAGVDFVSPLYSSQLWSFSTGQPKTENFPCAPPSWILLFASWCRPSFHGIDKKKTIPVLYGTLVPPQAERSFWKLVRARQQWGGGRGWMRGTTPYPWREMSWGSWGPLRLVCSLRALLECLKQGRRNYLVTQNKGLDFVAAR